MILQSDDCYFTEFEKVESGLLLNVRYLDQNRVHEWNEGLYLYSPDTEEMCCILPGAQCGDIRVCGNQAWVSRYVVNTEGEPYYKRIICLIDLSKKKCISETELPNLFLYWLPCGKDAVYCIMGESGIQNLYKLSFSGELEWIYDLNDCEMAMYQDWLDEWLGDENMLYFKYITNGSARSERRTVSVYRLDMKAKELQLCLKDQPYGKFCIRDGMLCLAQKTDTAHR